MIKTILILSCMMTLTACGFEDEQTETDPYEKITAKVNEKQKAASTEDTEEEEEVTEKINENTRKATVKETLPTRVNAEFQPVYDELTGKSFIFSSGAGAWRTAFTFTENGNFSGAYSDANGSEMFVSEFAGQFTISKKIDEFTYQLDLDEFEVLSETGEEEVDGDMTITYVDEPHGFPSGSRTFELYFPYKPKNQVSEEYLSWVYGQANNEYDFLNSFGLYNIQHQLGMEELLDSSE